MFISPMLLEYAKDNRPFNNDNYITELKLDGIRLVVANTDRVRLYTRHNNEITGNFPEIVDNVNIPKGTVLDGELIVSGVDGKPDFQAMMERFKSKKSKYKATFCAFDIVMYDGEYMNNIPLIERKSILDTSFIDNSSMTKSKYLVGHGIQYFNLVKEQGLEGVVFKLSDSKYEIGRRSASWLKVIAYEVGEFYISGYRKSEFGWLLSNGKRTLGIMELGVGSIERKAGYKIFQTLKASESKDMVFLQPQIRCVVKHRGFTKNGSLRLPVFDKFVI